MFDYVFAADTELTGHMKLHLWVEAVGANDMDLFVGIQKFDRRGEIVPFVFYAMLENGPVALGWLRASHRDLDPRPLDAGAAGAYPYAGATACAWAKRACGDRNLAVVDAVSGWRAATAGRAGAGHHARRVARMRLCAVTKTRGIRVRT